VEWGGEFKIRLGLLITTGRWERGKLGGQQQQENRGERGGGRGGGTVLSLNWCGLNMGDRTGKFQPCENVGQKGGGEGEGYQIVKSPRHVTLREN